MVRENMGTNIISNCITRHDNGRMYIGNALKTWARSITCIILLLSPSSHSNDLPPSSSCSFSDHSTSLATIPDVDDKAYVSLGDVNIGGFIMATNSGTSTSCSKTYIKGSSAIETAEAIAYAVKLVNEDSDLLPNVSLGFVLVNDCSNILVSVAKALQFLPQVRYNAPSSCTCDSLPSNTTTSVRKSSYAMTHYDVIGVISPRRSSVSVALSQLLSTSKIPQVGIRATSDELSDKSQHPFFLRLTAPDKFQVAAMLAFIQSNGWSYISLLHARGTYGDKAYERIQHVSPSYNICIATHHTVTGKSDFDLIVKDLLTFQTARAVILFIYATEAANLFKAINRNNARGTFIWIGGDGLGSSIRSDFKGFEKDVLGTFVFSYYKTFLPDLFDYIGTLDPNISTNPWLKPVWENLIGCSFSEGSCGPDASIVDAVDFGFSKSSSQYVDAVMVYAHAATKLLSDLCPGLSGTEARACIRGDDLLQYMKNISFNGYSQHIEFDRNGDARGRYEILQIGMGYTNVLKINFSSSYGLEPTTIAMYSISTGEISYTGNKISWDHLLNLSRVLPLPVSSPEVQNVPESVCSRPCFPGEYIIPRELSCCWECRRCRDNERLIEGQTICEECQSFTWPDPSTDFTTCIDIPLTFPSVMDPVPLILISLSVVATLCAVAAFITYVLFRGSRVIKASSKELSFIQIVAVVVGYITVMILQLPPTELLCRALYFTFCLSFACLYSALLIKAVRVYRIFLSSSKFHRNPAFVGWRSQMVMTSLLISVQVTLCLVTHIMATPSSRRTHPVPTEKYVELACDMTLPGLVSFLLYNLVLVFLCSLLAFKTRKLPDNFNESWFIFMCVATTLIIWIAFVPTYFTTNRESIKILMLSVALLLNHTVALVFLFIPKIYAAVYATSTTKSTTKFKMPGARVSSITDKIKPNPSERHVNTIQHTTEA